MMVHVQVDVGFSLVLTHLTRSDLNDVLLAVMVGKIQGLADPEPASSDQHARRKDIHLAEFLFKLEKIDRIVGMLQIGHQLLFGRLLPDPFGKCPALFLNVHILNRFRAAFFFKDLLPVSAKDLLIDPVSRLIKGKRPVFSEQKVFQIT